MAPLLKHNSELLFITSDKTGGSFPPNLTTFEGNPTAGHDLVAMNGSQRLQTSTESTTGLANTPLRESSGILGAKAIEANGDSFWSLMVTRPYTLAHLEAKCQNNEE